MCGRPGSFFRGFVALASGSGGTCRALAAHRPVAANTRTLADVSTRVRAALADVAIYSLVLAALLAGYPAVIVLPVAAIIEFMRAFNPANGFIRLWQPREHRLTIAATYVAWTSVQEGPGTGAMLLVFVAVIEILVSTFESDGGAPARPPNTDPVPQQRATRIATHWPRRVAIVAALVACTLFTEGRHAALVVLAVAAVIEIGDAILALRRRARAATSTDS